MAIALWSLKDKKILIVDDLAEMRSSLRNMLTQFDANNISMASTGEEAIEQIAHNNFDIILCDYNLGDGKDGQQVLEEAKLRGKLPYSTVFIMITAESSSFMVMGALEHQPDDYLSKPFSRNVLKSRLEKLLNKKAGLAKLSIALQQNNKTLAINLCNEGINEYPSNRNELLKIKTDLLISELRYDEAKEICDAVIAERSLPWARLCNGKLHYLQQQYESAQQYFEEIINDTPTFVSAYDWLAKAQLKLGDSAAAQKTIEAAIEQSAKSVTRQRMLAETSESNQDFVTAEKARRRSIRTAKNSVLSEATDYTKLAEALIKNDNPKEALKAIELAKHEFRGDEQAQIAATLSKSKIFKEMGREKESLALIDEVTAMAKNATTPIKDSLAIELTETFLANGNTDAAQQIVEKLVSNNHDNQELLDKVNQIYSASESGQDSSELVASVSNDITAINNKGVELLEAGNIDAAITLFDQALARGPNNQVININSAQAYLMKIKACGKDDELLKKTRQCLEKTAHNKELQLRYKTLNAAYWKFANNK